ncbi:glycosyltransferase [Actinomadura sp. 3N508]|uniref:glycosyltransferase n=1 Tax=Actinomadura sp. 3N508 TaxID=3375153 RepID=UPI00379AE979
MVAAYEIARGPGLLDAILAPHLPGRLPVEPVTDRRNRRLAAMFDAVVTTSAFAAAEFARVGTPHLHRVPLGVDLATFRPTDDTAGRSGSFRLVHLGRLSSEKRPDLAMATVRELRRRGVPVHLDVMGSGPVHTALRSLADRKALPVRFHGHVHRRAEVVRLLAGVDVALVTCPVESFDLARRQSLRDRGLRPEPVRLTARSPGLPAGRRCPCILVLVVGWLDASRFGPRTVHRSRVCRVHDGLWHAGRVSGRRRERDLVRQYGASRRP